ncbi:MAG TPA: CRISPR system precrRNA processing endoribonuclease RAMP protein Cas6 [Thermoanaerobaculia bacterium]
MSGTVAGYRLPALPYVRLAFTLRALAPAELPEYQGSMLRGAFGHALRTMVCVMGREQACAGCRLRRECVYTRLFETFVEGAPPPLMRGLPTSPRPYVFEPRGDARQLAAGATLGFDLLLVGQAADLQAFAVLAVERMAAAGLGRARHRFAVESVTCREPEDGRRELLAGGGLAPGAVELPAGELPDPSRACLRFVTPTRLKVRDRLVATIGFRALAFAMLRRTLELAHFHVPGAAIDWSFRPLLQAAGAVEVSAARLHWRDWQRYSNRQQCEMSLGGFVGELELAGDLAPFGPLLRAAEVLHVGKGATFGLGKMEIG